MLFSLGAQHKKIISANYSITGIVSSFIRVLFPYVWSAIGVTLTSNGSQSLLLLTMDFIVQTFLQAFAIWAVLSLRQSFSVLPEARNLITTGPYRYVRHPIYVAYIFIMLGRCLQAPSWFSFMGCMLLTLLFIISAGMEERELRYLEGYDFYLQKVPCFLPFIGTFKFNFLDLT